jgi:hypothetical protein
MKAGMNALNVGVCGMIKRVFFLFLSLGLGLSIMAGEGIPVGNAVFYPSVETTYTHTDNLFMQDSTMPYGGISDSYWEVRPAVGIELPFNESSIRFDLAYQYKNYNTYTLSSHNSYFADFKGNFKFANGFRLTVDNHFVRGVQEVREFDPGGEQVFGNTPFYREEAKVGLAMPVNQLNTLSVYGLFNKVHFIGGAYQQRPFFDYTQSGGGLEWAYHFTPVSSWIFNGEYLTSKPDVQRQDVFLRTDLNKKYERYTFMTGWQGTGVKGTAGHAKFGYTKMKFQDNHYADFSGLVADVGLGFQPAEFFKIDLTLDRHPYQSVYNVNNYYTSTGGQLQVHQQLSRYLFWTAGYRYQENNYPNRTQDVFYSGDVLNLAYYPGTQGQVREDKISRAYGEIGYHISRQFSLRANYQYEDRNSNIHYYDLAGVHNPYSFTENRFSIQAQIGW